MSVPATGQAELVRTPIARTQVGVDLTRGVAVAAAWVLWQHSRRA